MASQGDAQYTACLERSPSDTLSAMGFHAIRASPQQDKAPSKNRVGFFRRCGRRRARFSAPQPVGTVPFTRQPPAIFASGRPCWPSRDPIGEDGLARRWTTGKKRDPNGRQAQKGSAILYLFLANNAVTPVDPFGLYRWTASCDCCMGKADMAAMEARLKKAHDQLAKLEAKEWEGLPEEFTASMAACLKKSLAKDSELVINCPFGISIICAMADGLSFPGSGMVDVCCRKLKKRGGQWEEDVADLIIHEMVHQCGKLYHGDPNDPYKWPPWLLPGNELYSERGGM